MNVFDKITDKFFRKQWNVGLARIDINELFTNKDYSPNYKWLPINGNERFFADPFLIKSPDGKISVLYEDFHVDDQYGKISLVTVDEQFKPVYAKVLLDTRSHLSYPTVYEKDGKTYIIPEASKSGHVTLYEYDHATKSLINQKNIIQNIRLLDTTILYYNDKYWLFATKRGEFSNSKLYIYYANSFEGPYIPHAANPVKDSLNASRPAGNFIIRDGQIFRPTQNCAEYYGKSVTLNKVLVLNEKEFIEEPFIEITPPKRGAFKYGIHTINIVDDVMVIDALKKVFMPFHQINSLYRKMFTREWVKDDLGSLVLIVNSLLL